MKTQGVPGGGSLYAVTSEDDEPEVVPPSLKGIIEACQRLEEDCVQRVRSIS